jgi:uncharacterized protein (DUF2147 family)
MKPLPKSICTCVLAAIALMGGLPAYANVEGLWLAKDGGTVRIHPCGSAMCGDLASPGNSSDAARRSPPGTQVLIGMRPVASGKWTGTLYNVDDGKTYTGNLVELGPDTIRIEGCVLFFCGGENLTRVKSSASSAR